MSLVGIIANPSAGKDIRRLVAHGRVVPNHEKVNVIRRVLLALDAVGVERVLFMPDPSALGARAIQEIELRLEPELLELLVRGEESDSTRTAALMAERGVGCIVTLGGDGTNRAVARGSGSVPLMPISTGTNNVFPAMVEGTTAGLAAGLVARGARRRGRRLPGAEAARRARRGGARGHRADRRRSLARALSSRHARSGTSARSTSCSWPARSRPRSGCPRSGHSCIRSLATTPEGSTCGSAPEARTCWPPSPRAVSSGWRWRSGSRWRPATGWRVKPGAGTIAVDGERQLASAGRGRIEVELNPAGPRVVAVDVVLAEAARRGLFVGEQAPGGAR